MKHLKLCFAALVLTATLVVPAVAQARPSSVSGSVGTRTSGTQPLQWLADQIALTNVNLSPGMKRLVNRLISAATPVLCPLIAKMAAPALQSFVKQACLDIGKSVDPWTSLKNFTPILCVNPGAIFPDYAKLFSFACGFLV